MTEMCISFYFISSHGPWNDETLILAGNAKGLKKSPRNHSVHSLLYIHNREQARLLNKRDITFFAASD